MNNRQAAQEMFNAAVTAANDRSQPQYLERAYNLFSSSCLIDPTFGLGHFQMGNSNADMGRLPAAIACYRRALNCDPDADAKVKVLTNLGWFLYSLGHLDEALDVSNQATQIDPKAPNAWQNLSVINGLLDNDDTAVDCAQTAWKLNHGDVQTEIALAFAQMFRGDYAEGLKHFERRFEWRLQQYLHSPYPRWQGEPDGVLYLMSDQGLGDTLSFARFVEAACKRCKFVHASVHPELMRLFAHAFMHIKNINLIPQPSSFPQANYWTTFVSLPAALGLTDDEIVNQPHIKHPDLRRQAGWKVPDVKLHIGIAWKGNSRSDIDKWRSIPMEQFLELYRVPGIQLYSLQVDEASEQLYQAGATSLVRDLKPYIRDVVDTVSMLRDLDMVICLESALGHVCALAGIETWIPYSLLGRDWRAGYRGDKPLWAPRHRFFRQEKGETWQPVFERINDALREKIDEFDRKA